ncbi:hypothetical protein B0H13DRAFT_2538492 [Mycena leptocephala]|nr:hypothetical protein B0H13DRAFT_2538492 [Mycena leptocephala]
MYANTRDGSSPMSSRSVRECCAGIVTFIHLVALAMWEEEKVGAQLPSHHWPCVRPPIASAAFTPSMALLHLKGGSEPPFFRSAAVLNRPSGPLLVYPPLCSQTLAMGESRRPLYPNLQLASSTANNSAGAVNSSRSYGVKPAHVRNRENPVQNQLVRPPVLFDFAVSGQRRVDFTSLPEHMLRLDISRDVLDIPGLFNFLKASIPSPVRRWLEPTGSKSSRRKNEETQATIYSIGRMVDLEKFRLRYQLGFCLLGRAKPTLQIYLRSPLHAHTFNGYSRMGTTPKWYCQCQTSKPRQTKIIEGKLSTVSAKFDWNTALKNAKGMKAALLVEDIANIFLNLVVLYHESE